MRIAILVEGKTEKAFKPHLQAFLQTRLAGRMPTLDFVPFDGALPTGKKTIDAGRILRGEDLMVAIMACSELKAFINTILALCGTKKKKLIC